jgi:GNAT superfamily N-acetyltransferase
VNTSALGAPTPLTATHETSQFVCSHPALSTWLARRALANAVGGASRTYVICASDQRAVGFYALAAGSVEIQAAPSKLRRNMPDPLPVIVLGRLAVHTDWAGRGLGTALLKDAVMRSVQAAELIGVRAMLCHAIDDEAKAFYLKHGFAESPTDPLTVMLGLGA